MNIWFVYPCYMCACYYKYLFFCFVILSSLSLSPHRLVFCFVCFFYFAATQVLKALLTSVSSVGCFVHEQSLLLAFRVRLSAWESAMLIRKVLTRIQILLPNPPCRHSSAFRPLSLGLALHASAFSPNSLSYYFPLISWSLISLISSLFLRLLFIPCFSRQACYHIYLMSLSDINRVTAKGASSVLGERSCSKRRDCRSVYEIGTCKSAKG
jgi:hypothetical protein